MWLRIISGVATSYFMVNNFTLCEKHFPTFYVYVTVHCNKFLYNKINQMY